MRAIETKDSYELIVRLWVLDISLESIVPDWSAKIKCDILRFTGFLNS